MKNLKLEESDMSWNRDEKDILDQTARMLVNEKLLTPQEQLRFLAILREETKV